MYCVTPIQVGIVSRIVDPTMGPSLHENSRFITAGPARRVLFTTEQTSPDQIARLRDLGVELFMLGKSRVDLAAALQCLGEFGVKRLLVEGGATLNAELLRRNLMDEIYLYMAPLIFGGASAPTLVDGTGFERERAIRLNLLDLERMDDGALLLHYARC